MKGFERKNQLFSLCGLNCGLCPMLLGNYCGGCGNGNQSCRIAKCSLEHGKIEYCLNATIIHVKNTNTLMNTILLSHTSGKS